MRGKQNKAEVVFSIGSNCGDRETSVDTAIVWLCGLLEKPEVSRIYSTPDFHGGAKVYFNAVVKGTTGLSLSQLETLGKQYELKSGRDEKARAAGDVPIDIDVVKYDGCVVRPKDFSSLFFRIGYEEICREEM